MKAGPRKLAILLFDDAEVLDFCDPFEVFSVAGRQTVDLLRDIAPGATIHEDRRFVDNGPVITSAGIAAGIDMSLHVVERLLGREVAQATASHMEYPWRA